MPKDFTLVMDVIKAENVTFEMKGNGICYIKIAKFLDNTPDELARALKALTRDDAKYLILDLRNSSGGLVTSAIEIVDQFLPKGKLVASKIMKKDKKVEFFTEGLRPTYNLPMVVLVNYATGSASEMAVAALKDWNRATIIGTTTFGKGTVPEHYTPE